MGITIRGRTSIIGAGHASRKWRGPGARADGQRSGESTGGVLKDQDGDIAVPATPRPGAGDAGRHPTAPRPGIEQLVSSRSGVFLVLLWIGAMTVLQLTRQPGTPTWDHVWAEDGGVFLSDALGRPSLGTIGWPAAGYLQVVPRLLALVTAAFPLGRASLVMAFGSASLVACLSAYAYFASASLFRCQWARILLAGLLVLLPATAFETNGSAANLHWYLIFTSFLVFAARPHSAPGAVVGATIALAAALSDPLAGMLLPLALLQAVKHRGWRGWIAPLSFVVGLLIQLVVGVLPAPPVQAAGQAHLSDLPGIYGVRVAGSFLVGDRDLHVFWLQLDWAFAWVSLTIVVLLMAYGVVKSERQPRLYLAASIVYSVLFLAVPLMVRGTEGFLEEGVFSLNGSRYTLVPILFVTVAVLLMLDRPDPRLPPTAWTLLQSAFVIFSLGLVITNFSNVSVRSPAPSWRASVAETAERCLKKSPIERQVELQQTFSPGIAELNAADVAIFTAPPTWAVVTRCERVRRDAS